MLTTDFVNGSPRWIELGSDSPEATADFYSRVFGWEIVSGGARLADYLYEAMTLLTRVGVAEAGGCPS